MRAAAITFTSMAAFAVSLAGPLSRPATADDSAAHALAEKFAHAAERAEQTQQDKEKAEAAAKAEAERVRLAAEKAAKEIAAERLAAEEAARRKAEARRAADEAEMLRQARAEAEARRAADRRAFEEREKARLAAEEEKAHLAADQQRARAEAARLAQEAEQQRLEDERRAETARKAEAKRLAGEVEEKRRAEEQAAKAQETRRAEAARRAKEAEEQRIAAQRAAEEKRLADEARAKLEQERVEEAHRIAEKFRLAREARERERGVRNSLGGPLPPPEMDEPAPWSVETAPIRIDDTKASHVTVLLVMEPKRHGFSGTPGSANPVLCIGSSCYISAGAGSSADRWSRWKALGPANSLGRRAGPCRRHLTCAFRNVDLGGASGAIQPVDMGILHHDRRDIKTVRADRTCDVIAGRLYCASPVIGHRYRAWVVPESVAAKAGANALERALSDGLPSARSAQRDDWPVSVQALPTR